MATDNSPDPPSFPTNADGDWQLPTPNVYSILTLIVFIIVNLFTIRPLSFPMRLSPGHGGVIRVRIDYATAPLAGALVLLAMGALGGETLVRSAVVGDLDTLQPWQVLVLFFSMAYLCISLDLTGVLRYIAQVVLRVSGASGRRLLVAVFLLASVLTVFSSNDIVVLTLSPLLLHMTRQSGYNPLPYLFTCFFAANTMSMVWYLGNSTNVVVAMAFSINPYVFSKVMGPVALIVHLLGFAATAWYFRSSLPNSMPNDNMPNDINDNEQGPKRNMNGLADPVGGIFLTLLTVVCMVLLFVAGFANLPVWAVTSIAAGIAIIRDVMADIMYPEFVFVGNTPSNNDMTMLSMTDNNETVDIKNQTEFDRSAGLGTTINRNRTISGSSIVSVNMIRRDHTIHDNGPSHSNSTTADLDLIAMPTSVNNEIGTRSELATTTTTTTTTTTATTIITTTTTAAAATTTTTTTTTLSLSPSLSLNPRLLVVPQGNPMNRWGKGRFPRIHECMMRVPWAVLPFLVGEFAIVGALEATGMVAWFGHVLGLACQSGVMVGSIMMVMVTTVLCTGISNLPTTVLLSKTLASNAFGRHMIGSVPTMAAAQFAVVLGSNVGPCLSLPGCLAGLIWAESLAANGVPMRPWAFSRVGLLVMTGPLVIGAVVLGLVVEWQ